MTSKFIEINSLKLVYNCVVTEIVKMRAIN